MTFQFKRESGLIIVNTEIDDKYEFKMVLDNGIIETELFEVKSFSSLGLLKNKS